MKENSDPGSLSNLRDLAMPEPIPWWPPAPVWYFVIAFLAAVLLVIATRVLIRYRRNAYRRAALAELRELDPGEAAELPALLKRTALVAYPRRDIASLNGQSWLEFLDRTAGNTAFSQTHGAALLDLAYRPGTVLDAKQFRELSVAARHWIRSHREAPC
jgi:hypothetical protein